MREKAMIALRAMRALQALGLSVLLALQSAIVMALDPPHDQSRNFQCVTCHALHNSPGGTLNRVSGNANVCLSCHMPAGQASVRPFATSDEASPPMPDPVNGWTAGSGTSHRWDSGPSGHVRTVSGNASAGKIASGGTFAGRIEDTITITITTAGSASTARFGWASFRSGSGTGVLAGNNVALGTSGLTLSFFGAGANDFRLNDQWQLFVRTDLRLPSLADTFERPLAQRIMREEMTDRSTLGGEKVVCSTCHDQHSQQDPPFDPAAPPFFGPGTGWTSTGIGRHFQRQANETNQMCKVCHLARNVASSALGSHPVGITIPADSKFKSPALPVRLDSGSQIQCMSCHAPHYTDSGGANPNPPGPAAGDGFLLRTRIDLLCLSCHTNSTNGDPTPHADTVAGSHFNATTGALWGGNRNRVANTTQRLDAFAASSFPKHRSNMRGACINCHWPHGWPNAAAPASDYLKLWVERYDTDRTTSNDGSAGEALCFACHTTAVGGVPATPATSNIEADFSRGSALTTATGNVFRHPVNDNEQQGARRVECVDCHNPHKATATNRLAGVTGVNLAGTAITLGSGTDDAEQASLCFKCHGDTFNTGRNNTSNKRLDFNTSTANSAYHPVSQAGRGQSANLAAQLLGGLTTSSTIRCTDCHNSNAANTPGPVTDSAGLTYGPHGSANAYILRGNFSTAYTSTGWNNANAEMCFLCHSQTVLLARDRASGARTNFYGAGKDNLHWYHLTDKGVTSSCMSCHYDIHSNRSAGNTQYRVTASGTQTYLGTSPPPNVKTHLVNFAPDVIGVGGLTLPRWQIDTVTGVRTCNLGCHGENSKMAPVSYGPTTGDEVSYTY
jgi:predicted CXXCH cytochrome family protein